jgi:hypothetical protein
LKTAKEFEYCQDSQRNLYPYSRDMMSSEPIVGDKRSAPDAPDTSDDDGSQPERGKEAEAAGPKLDQAERQRTKKLRRDGEARNVSREERKMTAIMRQIEEMEQKEKAFKAGPCSTQLEGSVGNGNAAFARLWRERQQDRGCAVREVGRGARSLKTRERKRPSTSRVASSQRQRGGCGAEKASLVRGRQ